MPIMAPQTLFNQNLPLIASNTYSSFFLPVLRYRISSISYFDSVHAKAYPPSSHHLQPVPEEEGPDAEHPLLGDEKTNEKNKKKKKKELRPNFYHQTMKKWSVKISSRRTKFPWQEQGMEEEGEGVLRSSLDSCMHVEPSSNRTSLGFLAQFDPEVDFSEPIEKPPSSSNHVRPKNPQRAAFESTSEAEADCTNLGIPLRSAPWVQGVESRRFTLEHNNNFIGSDPSLMGSTDEKEPGSRRSIISSGKHQLQDVSAFSLHDVDSKRVRSCKPEVSIEAATSIPSQTLKCDSEYPKSRVSAVVEKLEESMDQNNTSSFYGGSYDKEMTSSLFESDKQKDASKIGPRQKRSNTEMAERTIPELELHRLRNEALKMKERMRVGPEGITEAVVESIHQKWKETEVVKLHIEGPPILHMKRTHDILEKKTGGIVIWRSGSSIVLFRGLAYKLPCARSFSSISGSDYYSAYSKHFITVKDFEQSDADIDLHSRMSGSSSEVAEADSILDQLGPRYTDWSGRDPLPVDADLLPGIIPGYKPPFRFFPYKTKKSLTNKEMTYLRRIARSMAPHFALGRNKQHQGLASGIVKLWEKSAIAKIAIKRGVQNTSNERMAEEIKVLTGGTLVSRNKEYIVFYRGNDFLTPSIRQTFVEREKLAAVRQETEEDARSRASGLINPNSKPIRGPFVAGTLKETLEAYSLWRNQPSSEERDRLRTDLALSQHASVVRYLERKLYFAIEKVRNAEKALAELQESLQPADLPTDLETVTDEERTLFRNIGLKTGSYLPLGRRGVFDGTVQNIHLNWKHLELAKIIVRRKNFAQVKQIAISLEAESGGVLISVDKTTKGYVIILYRGKNYQRPQVLRPKNLLSKKEALVHSIELQRREALNHHIVKLHEEIQRQKSQLAHMKLERKTSGEEKHLEVVDSFSDYDVERKGGKPYGISDDGGDEDSLNSRKFWKKIESSNGLS